MKKIAYVLLLAFLFNFLAPIHTVFAEVVFEFCCGEYHVVYIKSTICIILLIFLHRNDNI